MRTALVTEGILGHEKLALSHGALGSIYHKGGDARNAAAAFEAGVEVMLDSPSISAEASQALLNQLVESYFTAMKEYGGAPRESLLIRLDRDLSANQE